MKMMNKCIFLDKDSTLIRDVPYNVNPARIEVYRDIITPLHNLAAAGYKFILISNQAGIAKGYFTDRQLNDALIYLSDLLATAGVVIDDFYYCPHAADQEIPCDCRKPNPGMILKAAQEHDIALGDSWMIGDIWADSGAGIAAGCNTILIDRSAQQRREGIIREHPFRPDYILDDFSEVDSIILKHKQKDDGRTHTRHYSEV